MQSKQSVKASQLFMMFYICQMIIGLTYTTYMANTKNMNDYILSFIASFFLNFIMITPIYLLYKRDSKMSLLDNSVYVFGKIGYIFIIIYALYFLIVCIYNLSFYNNYISNITTPKISLVLVSVAIIACSIYGAIKGVSGLAQTSGILFILFVAGFLFLICAMLPEVREYNFTPFLYEGSNTFFSEMKNLFIHAPCISMMGLLFPTAKGNIKRGFFLWNIGVTLTLVLITATMIGSLGDYVKTQLFPFYALSGIASIGVFQRMDSIYIAIWTSGLFIKLSLFLYGFSLCIRRLINEKWAKISLFIASGVVFVLSLIINVFGDIYFFIQNSDILLVLTLLTGFFIPLVLLVAKKLKKVSGKNC